MISRGNTRGWHDPYLSYVAHGTRLYRVAGRHAVLPVHGVGSSPNSSNVAKSCVARCPTAANRASPSNGGGSRACKRRRVSAIWQRSMAEKMANGGAVDARLRRASPSCPSSAASSAKQDRGAGPVINTRGNSTLVSLDAAGAAYALPIRSAARNCQQPPYAPINSTSRRRCDEAKSIVIAYDAPITRGLLTRLVAREKSVRENHQSLKWRQAGRPWLAASGARWRSLTTKAKMMSIGRRYDLTARCVSDGVARRSGRSLGAVKRRSRTQAAKPRT